MSMRRRFCRLFAFCGNVSVCAAPRSVAAAGIAVIVDETAVCSCLFPAYRADGASIVTIEGLEKDGVLTGLQQAFIDCGATQCGFCTAGMLISATALLGANPNPTREDIVHALTGNICRCTGYHAIIDAIASVGRARA